MKFYLNGELMDPLVEMGIESLPSAGESSVGLFQQIPTTWKAER